MTYITNKKPVVGLPFDPYFLVSHDAKYTKILNLHAKYTTSLPLYIMTPSILLLQTMTQKLLQTSWFFIMCRGKVGSIF